MSSTLLTIDNIVVRQFDIQQFRVWKLSVRKVEIRHRHIVPLSHSDGERGLCCKRNKKGHYFANQCCA
jgi:hypothetical protein